MYHELILALNGFPGDVFVYDGTSFKVCQDLQVPLLHPSEVVVLNDLLEIATLHKQISDFLDKQEDIANLVIRDKNSSEGGLYLGSVCNGIREIVDTYIKTLADLELTIINNAYMTLTHVRTEIEPFRALFRVLCDMITNIRKQKSSCVIVEMVKSDYDSHIHLQNHLQRLIPWLNRTMYRQITNWIMFGTLADPFEEFFIQKRKKLEETGAEAEELELKPTGSGGENTMEDYIVDYSLVPAHLTVSLVEKIFFIGNSVAILKNSEKTKLEISTKQKQFLETMQKLPVDTFRTEELAEALDSIALSVGKDMRHLILTKTDLPKHLLMVKDFYLTGRGELFHDFLLNLSNISGKDIRLSDMQNAFRLSATRVQIQEEVIQSVEINLRPVPADSDKSLLTLIKYFELNMKLEWPLQILFPEESIQKYNSLLRFLLRVRLIQLELNSVWLNTRKLFRFPVKRGPAELKNGMSFFIDHLQYYLQADVLESQYSEFMNAIEKSENFEQIRLAHCTFQSNILAQSFRSNKKLKYFLGELLNVCSDFLKYMKNHVKESELNNVPINEGVSKEVEKFSSDFRKYMDLLLTLLKGLAIHPQSGQYLSQFLLRLDFNSYYSKMTGL